MNSIQLHGELGHKFGTLPPMLIRDPAEAVRALSCQLPGFQKIMRTGEWYVVIEDPNGKYAVDEQSLTLGMEGATIHILPAVEGAASQGRKGGIKLVMGIALIGASLFIPGMQGFGLAAAKGAWATSVGIGSVTYGHLALAGIALAFGGAAMMIAPQPAMPSADAADEKNSFVFGGPQNPSGQGFAVPCVFGRMRQGAIPVATRIETNQIGIERGAGGSNPSYTNWPLGYDPSLGESAEAYVQSRFMNNAN